MWVEVKGRLDGENCDVNCAKEKIDMHVPPSPQGKHKETVCI